MAELPELTVRVDRVERELERETGKREQSDKYIHRMIEDVQQRYQEISIWLSRIETAFTEHLKDDKRMTDVVERMDSRLRVVERLAWVAVGGLVVIAGLITLFWGVAIKMVG